jgi:hypothetical protein
MKKIYIKLIFFFYIPFSFAQVKVKKIEINIIEDTLIIQFKNKAIKVNKTKSYVTFSSDSLLCSIFRNYEGKKFEGWFDIYNLSGDKINKFEIQGSEVYLANDGRFAVYNPIFSENLYLSKSSMEFFDKSGNKINKKETFNVLIGAHFFENGNFFIIQERFNYGEKSTVDFDALILNKNFKIIARKDKFQYSSVKFIPPKFRTEDGSIIIPIKTKDNLIIHKKYDKKLNFISEEIY